MASGAPNIVLVMSDQHRLLELYGVANRQELLLTADDARLPRIAPA